MISRKKSEELFAKACEVLPGGVNSPVRAFVGLGVAPLVVAKGKGDLIWDLDGNSYIDYCGSWGALILGHAHPRVVKAAVGQVKQGSSFGITTAVEEALARRIIKHLPSIEKIRFVSSGTEATMSALRLARGYTGKSIIVKFEGNYHGHADLLITGAGSGIQHLPVGSPGVPQEMVKLTRSLAYNDTNETRRLLRENAQIAAVIVEPIAGNMGLVPAEPAFLQMLREETKRAGALLIFDEVITGFRVGLQGAQGHYGIEPDLTCLGKIVGGGFPAAAFGGKKEIMERLAPQGDVYQAGTLSGNPVAMHAGEATLAAIESPCFYADLEGRTRLLTEPIREAIRKKGMKAHLAQVGSMFSLFFGVSDVKSQADLKNLDRDLFHKLFRYALEQGVYLSPSPYETCFVSSAHTIEHLAHTAALICRFIKEH